MRNRNGGTALRRRIQGCLYYFFRLRVERRCSFVEEEDLGIAQERAGNSDALLLTSGKKATFRTDNGIEAGTGERKVSGFLLQMGRECDRKELTVRKL